MVTFYNGKVIVHPTEVVEVHAEGITKTGKIQYISICMSASSIDELRRTFEFQKLHCAHLGHAFWHVHEGHPDPCDACK